LSIHELVRLEKIIEERISSLREVIKIATNVRLNPLYIDNLRDEIQFLQWTTRLVKSIMNRVNQQQERPGTTKPRQELLDVNSGRTEINADHYIIFVSS
jgi:hypothetical protein